MATVPCPVRAGCYSEGISYLANTPKQPRPKGKTKAKNKGQKEKTDRKKAIKKIGGTKQNWWDKRSSIAGLVLWFPLLQLGRGREIARSQDVIQALVDEVGDRLAFLVGDPKRLSPPTR